MKKNNKKKGLLLGIISTLIVAIVGYGVYSYYWAEGTVTLEDGTVDVDGFNVTYYNLEGGEFIADNAYGGFECSIQYNDIDSKYYGVCERDFAFYNMGNTSVAVSLNSMDYSVYDPDGNLVTNASISATWSDGTSVTTPTTIEAKLPDSMPPMSQVAKITIEFPLENYSPVSSDANRVYSPVSGGTYSASATFKVRAGQVHD